MRFIGKAICRRGKEIGVISKENKKTYSYGQGKFVKKKDYQKSWDLCPIKKCNNDKYRIKSAKGKLLLRVRKGIFLMSLKCFPETYDGISKSDFINLSSFTKPFYHHYWLEDNDKQIITYFLFNSMTNSIWNVCTDDQFRKQNCFKTLFHYFLKNIQRPVIYLWVLKTNAIAKKAYEKLGFAVVGENETSYYMQLITGFNI